MLRAERQQKLINLINEKGIATIEELVEGVNSSIATVRRDINDMAQDRLIEKVRGGAKSIASSSPYEPSFTAKSLINADEKKRIAAEAVKHISPGDRIILDSGTTTLELAKLLGIFHDLTVVTNDIRIAAEINTSTSNDLISIGGIVRKDFCSTYGYFAETMLKNITVDKIFLSVDAIDAERGIMSYTMDDVSLKDIGMTNAKEVYLLCDHSKFSSQALFAVGMIDRISTIICGRELEASTVEKFQQIEKKLVLV
ncbi:MAG: DeoR/GlpR family DNA-binding transcription regulator [Eubacteriales bacterium]|nr:DeoR/GlpR family DNA-binding transcription regulator [Eubacteriales bacterium]